MNKINKVYIGVGTNLGDKFANIEQAYDYIQNDIGNIINKSSVYETKAWGFESDDTFYNSVIKIETFFNAFELLKELKIIEKKCGRSQILKVGYTSRIIDLDILDFNEELINSDNLIVPHSHICNRIFTVKPLFEIAPTWQHPKTGCKISERLIHLSKTEEIKQLNY